MLPVPIYRENDGMNEVERLRAWSYARQRLEGRERFVHPSVQKRVYTPIGTGLAGERNPIVLVDGHAVAIWTFSLPDGPSLQSFDRPPRTNRRVDDKLNEVAGLLSS
jgi:hypothetical protein